MKNLKSISISETLNSIYKVLLFLLFIFSVFPASTFGRINVDIREPGDRRLKVAIPDFMNLSINKESPELSEELSKVISNDLDLSGYFLPMDKKAFLDGDGAGITSDNVNFRNWTLIGTDLLIKGAYTCIGKNVEVDIRAYDPFEGKLIYGKRYIEKASDYRQLMHRAGNDIFLKVTGYKGMFLSKFLFDNNGSGNKEIYICDFDGYNLKKVTSEKSIALFPRWSPNGDSFVFTLNNEGHFKLYNMILSTGKKNKLPVDMDGLSARWHTDGSGMDITLRDRGYANIYTADINGRIIEKLTNSRSDDISPSRSPDGKKMVFVSDRSGPPQVYIKDLVTGTEERITYDFKYCTSPVWSALNKIAFVAVEDGVHNIYTMNPDGTGLRNLTEGEGNNEEPCWSPDGRYIVFSSNRSGGYHLYIMNANGFNQRRISFFNGEDRNPSWSSFK